MALAVRSSTQNVDANGVSSKSVTKPTGTADGDLLVAIMGSDPDTVSASSLDAPAGWTLRSTSPTGGAATAGWMKFWTKTAASEPSSWTFTTSSLSDCHITVLAITGANNSSPIDGTPAWTSNTGTLNTSHVFPSITTSQTNSLRIGATNTTVNTATTTWSAPGTWTSDSPSPTASAYNQLGVFHKLLTASGSTGTATATSGTATQAPGEMLLSFAIAANNGLNLTGSITATGTLSKSVTKNPFTGSITATGALTKVRVVVRLFTGSITATGVLAKRASKALAGSITPTGTFVKRASKVFTGSITATATLKRRMSKVFTGSITATSTLAASDAGRAFGKPGLVVVNIVKAGWVRARVRRD